MTTKKDFPIDESANDSGVALANSPLAADAINFVKIKKILPTFDIKNNKSELVDNRASIIVKPSNVKKTRRKHREMKKNVFGYELIMDLSECDIAVMSSKKKLAEYVDKLCKLIKMKKYGKVLLPYFGLEKPHTKGYSLLQFIETSSITGHFSEYWRKSYINIFSCKSYDHELAAKFTKAFFKAKRAKSKLLVR